LGAQFAGYGQRLPALALFGGALTGLPPAERARIAIDLGAQVSHRLLGRAPATLQGRASAERGGSGRCAHPDAVLGDPVQAPARTKAVKLSTSRRSRSVPTRKSASVLAFMPPHSH
jgi:hypothetical protein